MNNPTDLLVSLKQQLEAAEAYTVTHRAWLKGYNVAGERGLIDAGCPVLLADELNRSLAGAAAVLRRHIASAVKHATGLKKRIAGLERWIAKQAA